jgi:ComF family protein
LSCRAPLRSKIRKTPRNWSRILRSPLDALSCALLPAACSSCSAHLLYLTAAPVCTACIKRLQPQKANLCTRCGEYLGIAEFTPSQSNPAKPEECRPCSVVPPAFDRAVAFGRYEDTLRSLIHLLKYERIEPVATMLGATLTSQVAELCDGATDEILVLPVPLHRSKQQERGFNQSELLAKAVIRSMKTHAPAIRLTLAAGMLQRKRATESQTTLTNVQRRRNLRGAFSVSAKDAARLSGREVLLIDDIYTTGATARACSETLKKAGAARVWVATVARAQRDGVARWDAGPVIRATSESFVTTEVSNDYQS